jgi:hypothetical protein
MQVLFRTVRFPALQARKSYQSNRNADEKTTD